MKETMVLAEDEAIELFALLVTSARIQLDEPCRYAPMRLLSAAERLRDFIKVRASSRALKLLEGSVEKAAHAQIYRDDRDMYTAALDDLCTMVAQYLVEQSGFEGSS
jgi:hypothetical protein